MGKPNMAEKKSSEKVVIVGSGDVVVDNQHLGIPQEKIVEELELVLKKTRFIQEVLGLLQKEKRQNIKEANFVPDNKNNKDPITTSNFHIKSLANLAAAHRYELDRCGIANNQDLAYALLPFPSNQLQAEARAVALFEWSVKTLSPKNPDEINPDTLRKVYGIMPDETKELLRQALKNKSIRDYRTRNILGRFLKVEND